MVLRRRTLDPDANGLDKRNQGQRPPLGRPPTLRHMQLKVAGRELVQPLLELGGSRRLRFWL